MTPAAARAARITDIQRVVAEHFSLSFEALLGPCRLRRLARPRQIAMYLCRELTARSLPEIGERFGGRDHTTVMWAIHRVDALIDIDPDLAADVDALRDALRLAA